MVYIYVDDIREDDTFYNQHFPSNCMVIICRDYFSTIEALHTYQDDEIYIDLDHDLGFDNDEDKEYNGYNICQYIIENHITIAGFHIHTANPVGAFNMRQLLTHYGIKEMF